MNLTPKFRNTYISPFDSIHSILGSVFSPRLEPVLQNTGYPVDLFADEDNAYVRIEAPGLDKEAFEINIEQSVLNISIRKENGEENTAPSAQSIRRIRLKDDIDTAATQANYKNGVLELSLPKKASAKPSQIEIN